MSDKTKGMIASALVAAVSVGLVTTSAVSSAAGKKEKCYGVALKGKNACGTATHACGGQAKTDCDGQEWTFVDAGTCTKIGGKLQPSNEKGTAKWCK